MIGGGIAVKFGFDGFAHHRKSRVDLVVKLILTETVRKLDFDRGRPMEIEYLYSRPIAEARKAGFEMPKLAMLEAELRFIEKMNLTH